MHENKNKVDNFFTPSNFYSLQSAGMAVWILCLVIGSIDTELSSYWFRIIAISVSFLISISLFFKNKTWRKWYNYILIIFNACLIFVNASGFNSITYSYAFDNSRLKQKQKDLKEASILNFRSQKLWWPDNKLLMEFNDAKQEVNDVKSINKNLLNQISYFKDWVQSNISDKKSRDTLSSFLKSFGTYDFDTSNANFTNYNSKILARGLNNKIDSLKQELLRHPSTYSYIVGGKNISPSEYVDKLIQEKADLQGKLDLMRIYLPQSSKVFDSLLKTF